MPGSQPQLPPEVQSQIKTWGTKPPRPTLSDRISSWDSVTESGLRIWYRVCIGITAGLGTYILGMLIWHPEGIKTIIELVHLIISSGRGFAVPTMLLIIYTAKLLGHLPIRRGFSKEE